MKNRTIDSLLTHKFKYNTRSANKVLLTIVVPLAVFFGAVLWMRFSHIDVDNGIFILPFLIFVIFSSRFWGFIGGIISASVSALSIIIIALLRNPEFLNLSLVSSKIILVAAGGVVGTLVELPRVMKKERAQLKESERRWKTLFQFTPSGVVLIDFATHSIIDANPQALHLLGRERESVIGKKCFTFFCSARQGECPVKDLGLQEENTARTLIKPSGTEVPIEMNIQKATIGGREVLIESFIDISDLKNAQRNLQESKDRYKRLFEESPVPMFHTRMSGDIMAANQALLDMFGIPDFKTLKTMKAGDFYYDSPERKKILDIIKRNDEIKNREIHFQHSDGSKITAFLSARTVIETDGTSRMEGSLIDITELRKLEAKQKKLEAIATRNKHMNSISNLAAGLAHDINNILTAIYTNAQILQFKIKEGDQKRKPVDRILAESLRAADKLHGLLVSTGSNFIKTERLEINEFLQYAISTIKKKVNLKDKYTLITAKEEMEVEIDKVLIEEVLLEIIKNAVEAFTSDDSTVIIETGRRHIIKNEVYTFLEKPLSSCGCISITDNGKGMAQETVESIFDPYYTSKTFGQSAGVSLSRVFGIIQQHKGAIEIKSKLGVGTTVKLYLPLTETFKNLEEAVVPGISSAIVDEIP